MKLIRYTIPAPKLTPKQIRATLLNPPFPILPWKDYGNPRKG